MFHVKPNPEVILELIHELRLRPWPAREGLQDWLADFTLDGAAIDVDDVTPTARPGMAGRVRLFTAKPVSVELLVWRDADPVTRIEGFRRLNALLTVTLGEPAASGDSGLPAAQWSGAARTVSLEVLPGVRGGVQVTIDDAELAAAQAASLRDRHAAHPLSALGVPLDEQGFHDATDLQID